MRALVTGATGFIGGHVARLLLERGWSVTCLVRSPERAAPLRDLGATLAGGDVTEPATLEGPMRRAQAVFHLAAWYALGVGDRQGMFRTNVKGTDHVLAAAREAGIERVVYCSSVAALGSLPPGEVSDETTRHHGRFGSVYEETKWAAHERVRALGAEGAPVVTVMPGAVYGPGDPSVLGALLRLYAKGWLVACPFQDAGMSWVHVEDVAAGIVAAHDKGEEREEYVLGGDNETVGGLLRRVAALTGIRAPRFALSRRAVRLALPLGPLVARALGQEPRLLQDGLATMHGSFMASSAKAAAALGYTWRSLEEGMPPTVKWFAGH